MKVIPIKNGILHISENKAICPHCTKHAPDELMDKLHDSDRMIIRHKCKGCKRFIGITADLPGDLIAYEL